MFFEGIGNWLLLEMGIMGIALTVTLGWQALIWLVLLFVGVSVVVWCSIVATLLVIRYILPNMRKTLRFVIVGVLSLILLEVVAHFLGFIARLPNLAELARLPSPKLSSILLVLLLLVLVAPLADCVGKLYVAAFHTLEGRAGSSTVLTVPGITDPSINS